MDELTQDFLRESRDNLDRLEQDLVAMEKDPACRKTLASVFRTIHTLKGTCGFFSYEKLEGIAHAAENLLSLLRTEKLAMTEEVANALLATADLIREILAQIEEHGQEGETDGSAVVEMLTRLQTGQSIAARPVVSVTSGETSPARSAETTVRVSIALLDQLMNMVGELVLTRNQIVQSARRTEDAGAAAAAQRLNTITSELQERVMKTRMEPIGNIWNKFPRLVRDLEQACGKKVRLALDGAGTELDRSLLDAIRDPLTHLVRNAVDHGIESPARRRAAGKPDAGQLAIRAYHEGGLVNIEMIDDGAGIDTRRVAAKAIERGLITREEASALSEREAIELIFLPGFSTVEAVSHISGRGVGLDVVKTHIERIGGMVDVLTEAGRGTTFKIKIPLTLAIIAALTVTCGGERYAIPQVNVVELLRIDARTGLERVHGVAVHRLRDQLLPILFLAHELQLPDLSEDDGTHLIVVVQAGERRFGLMVEDVHDASEIVVKPLGLLLKGTPCLAGATIMGDGSVALILDIFGLARRAGLIAAEAHLQAAAGPKAGPVLEPGENLLIFGVGDRRLAMPLAAVDRIEEFSRERIEWAGAREAVHCRGQILPLISVAEALNVPADRTGPGETVPAIVYTENGRSAALVVHCITDIVRGTAELQRGTPRRGVLGSAIIGERLTDLLDVRAVIRAGDPTFFEGAA
jgi:two-component system chemotaxis sensor kinase CheA